ncbi:MAG: hypothetical protein K5762_05345, partial [Bacilli bacterium]|nr:hypothetical protein [Bacilli bacterium]
MINEANPSQAVLTIRSYEALAKVADGKATKLIIPSDVQNLATMAAAVTETVSQMKTTAKDEPSKKAEPSKRAITQDDLDAVDAELHEELARDHSYGKAH